MQGSGTFESHQKVGSKKTFVFQTSQSVGVNKQFTYKLKNDAGIRKSSVEVLLLKNALFRTLDFKVSPAVGVTKSTFETVKIQFGKWNNYHPLTEQIVAIATEVDVKSSQQIGTREPWLFFSRECLGLERCAVRDRRHKE